MLTPTFHITITGSVVAGYAAVVATCTAIVQVIAYLRDRSKVKLRVQHNMAMVGDPRYRNQTVTLVHVMNVGRRPVTITTVGARYLHPHNSFVLKDTMPPLPYELTEGKNLVGILDSAGLDFSDIDFWEAYDATGKSYRLKVSPWYKRWWSNRNWKRRFRTERKKKRAEAHRQQNGSDQQNVDAARPL